LTSQLGVAELLIDALINNLALLKHYLAGAAALDHIKPDNKRK
jgi:hypothetical protein